VPDARAAARQVAALVLAPVQPGSVRTAILLLSTFLASGVEMVEALTIVLAAGIVRGWRASLSGAAAAALALAVLVVAFYPALRQVPLNPLRLCIGLLLVLVGLQWLRKAILRASGRRALHDEEKAFAETRAQAEAAVPVERAGLDWPGFTLSFQGVFLEGLEVAVIVLTFGSGQGRIVLAALGALAALVVVVVIGMVLRSPLARVPENALKFAVGIMLTSYGVFWAGEGAHVHWPGSDTALLMLLAVVAAVSLALVARLRRSGAVLS